MPEPIISLTQEHSLGDEESTNNPLDKTMSRRGFLKLGALALAGAALTACDPKGSLSFEKDNLKENIKELNNQFGEIQDQYLDEQGNFNYEPFGDNPEFERYLPEIHTNSEKLGRELGINPNALKLLSSSIVSANLGDWQKVNPNQAPYAVRDRVGPMQFYPSKALDTVQKKLGDKYEYSVSEIEGIFNIQMGINHLVYGCIPEINKSGENKNFLQLSLAQYYGGDDLFTHIKDNKEVTQGSFLRESYDLYIKTASVMGVGNPIPKSVEGSNVERGLDKIWDRAVNYWSDSNLKHGKEYFFKQANDYFDDHYNQILGLSREQYLALFISIAMTESYGGTNRGPNQISGARGWFQVIPKFHLGEYNDDARKNNLPQYNEEQLLNDTKASIEIGTWALMRYRHNPDYQDIKSLMKMFKGGIYFGDNWDDGIWWNRVSYYMTRLLGEDSLNLGYIDYELPKGVEHSGKNFEQNGHAGN